MPLRGVRRDALAAVFFLVVVILYYYPLTLQGRVLAGFDTQVYFYPNAAYLASRLRLGQIPLWDPFIFGGVPFLANSQVAALYPPQWLFLAGPISSIYSWLVVGHVWLLAVGTYCLARVTVGLGRWGASFSGVALALSGFVGGMSGHLNQVESFTWLPFCILGLERTAANRRWRSAILAALPFALSALAGHSQVLFLSAILAVLAAAIRAYLNWRDDQRVGQLSVTRIAMDCLRLATGPVIGIFLAAAQLLPTLELTRLSIRAHGLSFADAAAFSLPPNRLVSILLPTIDQLPPSSEWYGWVGLTCLGLAGYGAWRRPSRTNLGLSVLAIVGLVAALGQYTPAYQIAFSLVPGVSLYRVPARWLTYWVLALAILGGLGVQAVAVDHDAPGPSRLHWLQRAQPWLWPAVLVSLALVGALSYRYRNLIQWPTAATVGLWIVTGAAIVLILRLGRTYRTLAGPALLALLVVELLISSLDLPLSAAIWPNAVELPGQTIKVIESVSTGERVLALGDNSYDPGNLADLRRQIGPTLPAQALKQSITSLKHVEGLTPNLPLQFGLRTLDGYDGGILPLDRFLDLKRLFPVQGPNVSDGRLRIQLRSPPPARLLGWLNLRFLVMDRLRDRWIDGVYYDLALSQTLASGDSIDLRVDPSFSGSGVGLVVEDPISQAPSGRFSLSADSLLSAIDVGSGPTPRASFPDPASKVPLSLWSGTFAEASLTGQVRLTWVGNRPVALRALTLTGSAPARELSVPVDPSFRLMYLGDMKIYDNQIARPRAFLADGLTVLPTIDSVIARLKEPWWDPTHTAVASGSDVDPNLAFEKTDGPGSARILVDEPEHLVIASTAPERKVLVVTDTAYPGWQATIDGIPAPIQTVDVMFRGIVLSTGNHTVDLRYEPTSWKLGLALSGLGVVAVLGGLLLTSRRPARPEPTQLQ